MDEERVVDFVSIAEAVPRGKSSGHFTAPKTLNKLWEGLRKNLRDPNKRENEFQSLCRNEVTVDFWTELLQSKEFHARMVAYNSNLGFIERFQAREQRFKGLVDQYFTLFQNPEKLKEVVKGL